MIGTYQIQPSRKSCGQTCVAMLLDIPASQVIADIPDKKGTHGHQLAAYLNARGFAVPSRPMRYVGTLPAFAIVRIRWDEKQHKSHWMLWGDGQFVDPLGGDGRFADNGGRIISYLPLERA
jgi:hypothetical protein